MEENDFQKLKRLVMNAFERAKAKAQEKHSEVFKELEEKEDLEKLQRENTFRACKLLYAPLLEFNGQEASRGKLRVRFPQEGNVFAEIFMDKPNLNEEISRDLLVRIEIKPDDSIFNKTAILIEGNFLYNKSIDGDHIVSSEYPDKWLEEFIENMSYYL